MNKGITIWEEHVEKIVLALLVLVLLAVLGYVVVAKPNTTQVGGRDLAPGEVNAEIMQKATDLGLRLKSSAQVSDFDGVEAASADSFITALDAPVSPGGELKRGGPALASILLPEEVGSVDVLYYEPAIDAPMITNPVVQTMDTIVDSELDRVPELASHFEGSPLDIAWTTPVVRIDLAGIRRELEGSDSQATPPREHIPGNWFNDRPYILDVLFERQTMQPDGSWSAPEEVPPVLGARSIREELASTDDHGANFREDVTINLEDPVVQQEILQPDFFATVNAGVELRGLETMGPDDLEVPMGEFAQSEEEVRKQQRIRELEARLRDRTSKLGRLKATLDELGGPLEEEEDTEKGGGRGRGRDGGGGAGGGSPGDGPPGFGGSGMGRRSGDSQMSKANKRRRISMTRQVKNLEAEIKKIQNDLLELDPASSGIIEAVEAAEVVSIADVETDESVYAWTHDIEVEPGAVYRYRATVRILNPLFARGRQLLESQRSLADEFALDSMASDWSEPVAVDPPVQFYFVRANRDSGSIGLGEARVELYRYYDGRQRTERSTVEPGERIGGSEDVDGMAIDFSTEWYLVDIVSNPAASSQGGLDGDEDSFVICRRVDGTEIRIRVPSNQLRDPNRTRLEFDSDSDTQASR
ncbi:MAG: hypothetical protein MK085_08790 [Phycisphaerales bacterium]|nr:hypothetical protein [Phycisphaerales bacterium]